MSKRWYVVHAYSGMEKSVARALQDRVERAGMQEQFGKILVPTEEVVEMKNGQRTISERRFFPGYVLVEMEMNDDTWHLVKNTGKVTGFVGGSGHKPTPISEKEVDKIMSQMQEGVEKPKPKTLFEVGEMVRVREGPFTDFNGNVEEVNYEKSRLRVSVTIFGRATPVELEFGQVEKLSWIRGALAPRGGSGHPERRTGPAGPAHATRSRSSAPREPALALNPDGASSQPWPRRSSVSSSCRFLQARPTRRRPSGRRSVSAA